VELPPKTRFAGFGATYLSELFAYGERCLVCMSALAAYVAASN